MKRFVIAMALVMALALPAMGDTNYNVCFATLDADGNGTMSKAEFIVAFPNGDIALFESIDTDKDGTVTHEEWEVFKAAQGFEHK